MRVLKLSLFLLPALFLAACGTTSRGTSPTLGGPGHVGPGTTDHDNPALQVPDRIGSIGVGPRYTDYDSLLPFLPESPLDVRVAYGTIRDGTGRIAEYLAHDAGADGHIRRFGMEPPIICVAEGATPGLIRDTLWAVQTINASLPDSWQLRFASEPAAANAVRPPDGQSWSSSNGARTGRWSIR